MEYMKKDNLITIVGPTAVGKTELTLQLAEALNSPVISGDAYQVYRGFSIGTAKPSPEELNRVKHYLIDILDPSEGYSAADFQREAGLLIRQLNEQKQTPVLSGGTGFYVQSLLEQYHFSAEPPNQELREQLDKLYAGKGLAGLLEYGRELAKKGGIELQFEDKHRLYRAIELMAKGNYEALTRQTKDGLSYEGPVIGLSRSREELYERINRRVDAMVKQGLFEEVESLLAAGIEPSCQAFKGIGYKESAAYIEGTMSREAAIEMIKQNSRRFAKRQLTWYRRMPYIRWINIDSSTHSDDIYRQVMELVKQ